MLIISCFVCIVALTLLQTSTEMTLTIEGFLMCKDFIDNSKNTKTSFFRLTVAVQEGYSVSFHKIYIFKDEVIQKMGKINIGSDVTAKGYISSNGRFKVALSIEETTHSLCPECRVIVEDQDAQGCSGCLNPIQEKIAGVWELVDRTELAKKAGRDDTPAVKLFFKQQENMLCFVTFPNSPHFKLLSELKVEEKVILDGWRDEMRHTSVWMAKKSIKRKRAV